MVKSSAGDSGSSPVNLQTTAPVTLSGVGHVGRGSNPVRPVQPIGPRLRWIYYLVLLLLGLLVANSAYLLTITALQWLRQESYQNYFYQLMFLAHLLLGLLFIVPFLVFAVIHMANARHRGNPMAIRVGYALFAVSLCLLVSGLLLFRVGGMELKNPMGRSIAYWVHIGSPFAAVWLYVLHRLAGPRIRWRYGAIYVSGVGLTVAFLALLHTQDPRHGNQTSPADGQQYFHPSLARTESGNFISADVMMMDDYCRECHADVHRDWERSAHRFSSFNNPVYLASIRETRKALLDRDGSMQASRWCAGCHDPVPFFSGAFDDPLYDDVHDPTSQAGITCTACHSITQVNSNRGNADYTIQQPVHYPFAFSDNKMLQWVNRQLVKAKPQFHKETFLKPHHKTAEFCSTCHKVHLPLELTGYKEFLRGQNHYDTFLLSGVSGHSARSFYYPETAHTNCNGCHMPLKESNDFAANYFDPSGKLKVHNHLFPGANTAMAWLKQMHEAEEAHRQFLRDSVRVDLFGIRQDGSVDGQLMAPLGPERPVLRPGETYLLETVLRTLTLGHPLTEGTADSNELWVEVRVSSDGQLIAHSGLIDESGQVDRWSHFVNIFMLDQTGDRINRRNTQDIRVPLYNNQIPPGASHVVHYRLELPPQLTAPVTIDVRLRYRKFDAEFMEIVAAAHGPDDHPLRGHTRGQPYGNPLPIVTLASAQVTLPVAGVDQPLPPSQTARIPLWQRWNDYGIGLLLKGKAQLKQAEEAFQQVEKLGRFDGPLNLARVYQVEGRPDDAVEALRRAARHSDPAAPSWTLTWLSAVVDAQQGNLERAVEGFQSVLATQIPDRNLDFSCDYVVMNELGQVQFQRALQFRDDRFADQQQQWIRRAIDTFKKTLAIDSENATAHYNLQRCYQRLGDTTNADRHGRLHLRYKPDDSIAGDVIRAARRRYRAADHAAEDLVIYNLHQD